MALLSSCLLSAVAALPLSGSFSGMAEADSGQTELDERMRLEADTFLARLPAGLQSQQRDAVRAAIAGNSAPLNRVRASRNSAPPAEAGVSVTELSPTLRLYRNTARGAAAPAPLLVYFHGGGWTFGSLNSCARFCAALCRTSGVTVLAADYPLAPEYPYPAAPDACEAAVRLALDKAAEWGCDTSRVAVGGDSSGGNLALAAALRLLRNGDERLSRLLLFYPVVDARPDASASWRDYAVGYGLDADLMEAFNAAYAADAPERPDISVALADAALLRRLPATLLVAAGRDILADQGARFAEQLDALGVDIRRVVFPSAVHLFITVPGQSAAFDAAVKLCGEFLP